MPPQYSHRGHSIGDFSRILGATPRALRHYESIGLLEPRRDGLNRVYARREYQRARVILEARRAGLSLKQVRELLDLYEPADGGAAQVSRAVEYVRQKIDELERQKQAASETLAKLMELLDQ